ncbi:CopD family protein [Rubellimicrobium aerolatum]|uniref:Protoporphyrinogen IX oxidase n=1 Tax=Rubellimicrobium aerolatum TaxID=490979 RepID=A0ABW0SF35_9RHOB|nr:CopD family protein [Rubellimicrobium aerolatum]MBP1806820.1 putative membrane protein [Rubellimicrobium aerolatum]
MTWAEAVVPHLKVLHIGFLSLWVAGLVALPRMLARHDPAIGQADFARIRHATHYGYVWAVTPAAVLAIASGTALIFLREVFTAWMLAKLVLVAGLVALHAWVGHTLVQVAETEGRHEPPGPLLPLLVLLAAVLGILVLVLAKPELAEVPLPRWLLEPVGGQLPFDVPRR